MAKGLFDPSFAIRSRTEGNFFGCQEFEPARLRDGFSAARAVNARLCTTLSDARKCLPSIKYIYMEEH